MTNKIVSMVSAIMIMASAFLFIGGKDVSALCPIGQYSAPSGSLISENFECKQFNDNANTEEVGIDSGGPKWARNVADFFVALAVVVGYATEVVAMLTIAYASYIYTISEGDANKLRQAKMYMIAAVIGMFVGAFSLIIARMLGGVLM